MNKPGTFSDAEIIVSCQHALDTYPESHPDIPKIEKQMNEAKKRIENGNPDSHNN